MKRSPTKVSLLQNKSLAQSVDSHQHNVYFGAVLTLVFVVGLILGFVGRPVLFADQTVENEATAIPVEQDQTITHNEQTAMSAAAKTGPRSANHATPVDSSNDSGQTPTVLDFVLADARQFEGDANAPVTLIEL